MSSQDFLGPFPGGTRLGHSQSWCRHRYCGHPSHEVRGSEAGAESPDECQGLLILGLTLHDIHII